VEAIKTPTGLIPKYEDLKRLFRNVLNKDYSEKEYQAQFTIRVKENLGKIDRVESFYRQKVDSPPEEVFFVLEQQRKRLLEAQKEFGDYISPFNL
jgi:phosphoenolpyruvate carboxykinase (GTP)